MFMKIIVDRKKVGSIAQLLVAEANVHGFGIIDVDPDSSKVVMELYGIPDVICSQESDSCVNKVVETLDASGYSWREA